uniref:Uncharacterized protein n=1 Tax=Nelumbo nucifera TaxID=4432 RepID=A0A822YLL8_NELNU|nr:TPA_asm: hypothetical protein HUJ06_010647 [Nelumbo nucifera]
MELSLTFQYQPPKLPQFRRSSHYLIGDTRICQVSNFSRRASRNLTVLTPKTCGAIVAKKKSTIESLSEEMNSIASQNMDFAPARRRVRSAFMDVQQKLDHILFKTVPPGIRTEEWYERNSRGLEIFCKSWLPKESVQIKGALFFCHGYGSTCTFFFEEFQGLQRESLLLGMEFMHWTTRASASLKDCMVISQILTN